MKSREGYISYNYENNTNVNSSKANDFVAIYKEIDDSDLSEV